MVTSDNEEDNPIIKSTTFDVNKTYYLSNDGVQFALAKITRSALQFATSDFATVNFALVSGKNDEYQLILTDKTGSIQLGYKSSTDLSNSASNWKIQNLAGGGLVLVEVSSGRYLGLSSSGASTAKAYANSNLKIDSRYPPVYLFEDNTK